MEYVSLLALGQALASDSKLRILRSGLLGMSKYNLFIVKDTDNKAISKMEMA
jgi:hypothetical protein